MSPGSGVNFVSGQGAWLSSNTDENNTDPNKNIRPSKIPTGKVNLETFMSLGAV